MDDTETKLFLLILSVLSGTWQKIPLKEVITPDIKQELRKLYDEGHIKGFIDDEGSLNLERLNWSGYKYYLTLRREQRCK